MSKNSWAQQPTPKIPSEHFPSILAGLALLPAPDCSAPTLCGLTDIDPSLAWHDLKQPRVVLQFDDTLIADIGEDSVMYPLRHPEVGNDYFVEYLRPQRSLWLKYQQILGSRLLISMTDEQAARFEAAVLALHHSGMSGVPHSSTPQPSAALTAPAPTAATAGADSDLLAEIRLLTVHGARLELPARRLKHYPRIKALVEAAGGRYARNGFTFGAGSDVAELFAQLCAGERPNPKSERQAFFTPPTLAEETVGEAAAMLGGLAGKRVLEPSGGEGALADAARQAGARVLVVENHGPSAEILRGKGHQVLEQDFLELRPQETGLFDAVIANPPFTRDQNIAHVQHMWEFVRPGGAVVTLMSPGWRNGQTRVRRLFREFVDGQRAHIEELPEGSFKASGTMVNVVRVKLTKPSTEAGSGGSEAMHEMTRSGAISDQSEKPRAVASDDFTARNKQSHVPSTKGRGFPKVS